MTNFVANVLVFSHIIFLLHSKNDAGYICVFESFAVNKIMVDCCFC